MSILRILSFSVLIAIPLYAKSLKPIVIVYSLMGTASITVPGEARQPLQLFDRLPAETVLEAGPDSRVALAFVNGLRYELGEGSRVKLGLKDLASRTGPIRALPRIPPLPHLSPIAAEARPGARAGAVRIRAETITGLHPDRGAVSLASAIRLRFDRVPAAPAYRVQIVDLKGKTLFRVETPSTEVDVPPEAVEPGRTYRWTVETRDRPGPVARGEAILLTLDANRARAREELRRWVQDSGDADDLRLLEGVDRTLGLQEELDAAERCPLSEPGLVIETVAPESAAFRAGLMPGDRLFSWCRTAGEGGDCVARGDLRNPFDWLDLQMEYVQRGGVVVEGARGSESLRWNLLPTLQGLTVAPLFLGELAEAYQASLQAGDPGEQLRRAAEKADGNHCAYEALWLRNRIAQLRAKARQWPEVDSEYQTAVEEARALGAVRTEEHLLMDWAETLAQRGEAARARQQLERALWLEERDHPESLVVVAILSRLGNVAVNVEGNLEKADLTYRRAYDLALRTAPGGGAEASTANNLSITTYARGDLAQAEQYAARALAIREKLTPASDAIAPSLVSYGNVLYARGDLAGAEAIFLRAKKLLERFQPASPRLAKTLHNLGVIAHQRNDPDAAESLFQRELALFEKLDPSGSQVLDSLIGLGEVALQRNQVDKAEESWQRALRISEKSDPEGPKTAWCLYGLAQVAKLRGQYAEAEKRLRRALSLWERINPESVDAGTFHLSLGFLLFEQGKGAAESHLRTSIRIHEKQSRRLYEGYQALARLQARRGQVAEAAATYLAAIDNLEAQRIRLGGAQESQWLHGSSLGNLYFEAAEHSITLARPQEAWKLIERGRAQGFQELLAQRDLRFPTEVPAELYSERHRLAAEYDRVQKDLLDWGPEQGSEKMEHLQGSLRDLRLEQAKVQERIRRSSPRLDSFASSTPIDLATVRSTLDPGTVLLTYAVGESRSFLFVLQAEGTPGPGFSFYSLPVGRESLASKVETFRRLLGQPNTDLSALKQRGRHLHDLLVGPARPVIAKADRWVISPDGPLHSLPFAALVSGKHYLVESKPIHIVASAAVYKELKERRPKQPSTAAVALLAVGDPVYPAGLEKQDETSGDPQLQMALRRGLRLSPLPATRGEVQAISSLLPGTQVLLGSNATEEAIKSLAPRARRLHFACHGLLDERFPLNSALALSIPKNPEQGRDNGLLQAWEIFEELRLDADLVTLSACDSGLGKEIGGEGLVGLARAFQFAGARSVLASLWSVSDASTADLMKQFYGHLRNGKTKDEALRAAQVDQVRSKSGSAHPFYWAAFQLTGDWQ